MRPRGPRRWAAGHRGPRGSPRGGGGVFPDRLPGLPPRPELSRHRPGRQAPASEGSGNPRFPGGKDVTTCFPPLYGDGLSITPSDRSGREGSETLRLCPAGSGNAKQSGRGHPDAIAYLGVARRGGRCHDRRARSASAGNPTPPGPVRGEADGEAPAPCQGTCLTPHHGLALPLTCGEADNPSKADRHPLAKSGRFQQSG
jgi:hypothetical protein